MLYLFIEWCREFQLVQLVKKFYGWIKNLGFKSGCHKLKLSLKKRKSGAHQSKGPFDNVVLVF